MKKILSIILALGLVLSMSLAAMPASAQPPCGDIDVLTLSGDCDGETMVTYTMEFDITRTMTMGVDTFQIEFPAGTAFGATFGDTGDVTVEEAALGAVDVHEDDIEVAGTTVTITVPETISASSGNIKQVTIVVTKVTNTAEGEDYPLTVTGFIGCCDPFACWTDEFDIAPKYSTYEFMLTFGPDVTVDGFYGVLPWDGGALAQIQAPSTFAPEAVTVTTDNTYAGIADDFIVPFKACGQDAPYGWERSDEIRFTPFEMWLRYDDLGCDGYDPVIINFWLEDVDLGPNVDPEDGIVTLYLWGIVGVDLGWHEFELNIEDEDPYQWGFAPAGFALANNHNEPAPGLIHFNIPGYYEICFELEYLGDPTPCNPIPDKILAEMCLTAQVMQEKDSFLRDPFDSKWNFFSTPLRLKYDGVADVFAPVAANLRGVYHWDNAQQKWFGYSTNSALPGEYQSLSKIEDGKGYLVRMKTDYEGWTPGLNTAMWLFGHAQAYAPSMPFSYNVVTGWTMMGYTSLALAGDATTYLEPAVHLAHPYGVLGLDGNAYVSQTLMNPGFGYWVYFTAPGTVVP